jgi:hypothetical protein
MYRQFCRQWGLVRLAPDHLQLVLRPEIRLRINTDVHIFHLKQIFNKRLHFPGHDRRREQLFVHFVQF